MAEKNLFREEVDLSECGRASQDFEENYVVGVTFTRKSCYLVA